VSQKGELGFIGTADSCVVVTFTNGKVYAPEKPVKRDLAAIEYKWQTRTTAQQAGCNEIKAAALPVKVLKAVPSTSGTRRTRDITATTYTDMRVPDSVLCIGEIVKKYQKNKNWYRVKDLDVTTLCGQY